MKTYYIPVHFYEREPADDVLVRVITSCDIDEAEFNRRLRAIANRHLAVEDTYPSAEDMVDAIFTMLARELNGVWSYCKKQSPLVVGDPQQTEEPQELEAVTPTELAALLIRLKTNVSLDFYEEYDEESGMVESAYRAVMINEFGSDAIYINCYGGGLPCVIDVTTYDTSLKKITEDLIEYFGYMENAHGQVYVNARLLPSEEAQPCQ